MKGDLLKQNFESDDTPGAQFVRLIAIFYSMKNLYLDLNCKGSNSLINPLTDFNITERGKYSQL